MVYSDMVDVLGLAVEGLKMSVLSALTGADLSLSHAYSSRFSAVGHAGSPGTY